MWTDPARHFAGFPLDKAVEYANLRNPLLINDLNMQYFIQDRYAVQTLLAAAVLLPGCNPV